MPVFSFSDGVFEAPDATMKIQSTITNRHSRNSNIFMPRSMCWAMAQTRRMGMQNELARLPNAPSFSPYHCGVSRARRGRFTFNAYGQLPDIGFTLWPKGHKRINGLAK